MKKFLFFFSSILLVIFLTACSESESTSIESIYQNAMDASQELESFALDMEMEQSIGNEELEGLGDVEGLEGFDNGFTISTTSTAEMQMEPMAFHQTMEMMGTSIEMYYTEDGLFVQQFGDEQWIKAPQSELDQINELMGLSQQQSPVDQLEQLKQYVDDFSYEENDNYYVLSLNADNVDMQELLKQQLGNSIPEEQLTEEMLESITINDLFYKFTIEKETYYPSSLEVEMNIAIDENGEETTINQTIDATYSEYNAISNIVVPEEILNSAEEMTSGF